MAWYVEESSGLVHKIFQVFGVLAKERGDNLT